MKTFAVSAHTNTARPVASVVGWIARVVTAWRVARERHELADLDSRMLADIGVTPDQAARETGRAFWDLPTGR